MDGDLQTTGKLYFRIGDVAEMAGVKPHVLRYWEAEFPVISPEKSATGQRVYKRSDVETVLLIRHLLYVERYSIEGARKRIKELRKSGELKKMMAEVAAQKLGSGETGQDTSDREQDAETAASPSASTGTESSGGDSDQSVLDAIAKLAESQAQMQAQISSSEQSPSAALDVALAIAQGMDLDVRPQQGSNTTVTSRVSMIEIRGLAEELKELAEKPLEEFFRY